MPICGSSHIHNEAAEKAHLSAGSQVGPFQDSRPQSSQPTITSAVAADPTLPPSQAAKHLFPKPSAAKRGVIRFKIKEQLEEGRGKHWNWNKGAVHDGNREPDDQEIERVRHRFGYKPTDQGGPSRLYLMVLADCLLPLPRNPMSGVVSPPLLATTGIVPLSIFSTGPDIIGHYYDCIVAARKEVILLTNYWQGGKNVDRIAEALRELNNRVQKRRKLRALQARRKGQSAPTTNPSDTPHQEKAARQQADLLEHQGAPGSHSRAEKDQEKPNGDADAEDIELGPCAAEDRIVVKLMWDRGPQTLADLFRLRKPVPPGMWKANGLPTENEIPNLTMEILNYHRPLMGTFHAKLLIVDRQVALINSNNIQDRPNVEACIRLEGDIVNSIYDHALISWGNRLQPALPCLTAPAPVTPSPEAFMTGNDSTLPSLTTEKLHQLARNVRQRLHEEDTATELEKERSTQSPIAFHFGDVVDQVMRRDSFGAKGAAATEHHVDGDKAARSAGAAWAQKVLGERFSQFQSSSNASKLDRSESDPLPQTGPTQPAQPPHQRKHFADLVEALMKKEGHKPPAWAEGALEVFGLGQSSSKNVAQEVRRNPRPRATLAAGANVPTAVAEEDQSNWRRSVEAEEESLDDAPSHTAIDEGSASPKAPPSSVGSHDPLSTQKDTNGAGEDTATLKAAASSEERSTTAPPAFNTEIFPTKQDGATEAAASETKSPSSKDDEGVPGSVGYRRVHRRTLSQISKSSAAERLSAITKSLDFANNSKVQGEIKADQLASEVLAAAHNDVLDFQPYTFHKPHEPVPMALVNRRPHGTPGHSDIRNPQDAAWLAGFRYAKKHVFIQSPTLNASPIKAAVLAAVRRHVKVELWLDLGFNDKSESMPFQGGTNEQVVTAFYRQLRREGKGDEKYLEVYWYTGKDMTRPLNAVRKQRNCHVKFAAFDGHVAVLGSGNQDTQSWFHSQEINVMVDSKQIVDEWMAALSRNQSTKQYGMVDQRDGIWRGRDGKELADTGKDQAKDKSGESSPPATAAATFTGQANA